MFWGWWSLVGTCHQISALSHSVLCWLGSIFSLAPLGKLKKFLLRASLPSVLCGTRTVVSLSKLLLQINGVVRSPQWD